MAVVVVVMVVDDGGDGGCPCHAFAEYAFYYTTTLLLIACAAYPSNTAVINHMCMFLLKCAKHHETMKRNQTSGAMSSCSS